MASSRIVLFFFCSVALQFAALTVAQQDAPLDVICVNEMGYFSKNSIYQTNLNHVLSSLITHTKMIYGFYTATYGLKGDQVNAMVLCRGDVKDHDCHSCIGKSTVELQKRCPNQKESVIWYDRCMVRYSNRYFFDNMEFGPWFWMYNSENVSDATTFNRDVATLLDSLKTEAASANNCRKFATGNAATTNSLTTYALVQCAFDMSKEQCIDCLNKATALLPGCCDGRKRGRVMAPSCNFRYDTGPFYVTS